MATGNLTANSGSICRGYRRQHADPPGGESALGPVWQHDASEAQSDGPTKSVCLPNERVPPSPDKVGGTAQLVHRPRPLRLSTEVFAEQCF